MNIYTDVNSCIFLMRLYNLSQEMPSLSDKRQETREYKYFSNLKALNFIEFERLLFPTLLERLTTMQPFVEDKDY